MCSSDLYYITAFINENSELIQKEKDNNEINYVINLKKDRVLSFLDSYYDVEFLEADNIEVVKDVLIHVKANKKGIISRLDADFSEAIKYKSVKDYEIKMFKLQINYENFNGTKDVKIPERIIQNSYSEQLTNIRQYAVDYVKGVNELKLGNTTINNTFGYSIKEANLQVIENKVTEGTIIIDDYQIKIEKEKIGMPIKIN